MLAAIFQKCLCVFQHPAAESQVNNNSTQNSLTEEQRAEAEMLKTDGKTTPVRRKLFFTFLTESEDSQCC